MIEEDTASKQKYTLKNLRFLIKFLFFEEKPSNIWFFYREIFEKVQKISNELNDSNKEKLVESIESLTAILMWGHKYNDDFFE